MTTYEYHNAGNSEAQQKEALTYLLSQSTTGKATTGALSGLAVTQTSTASGSVLVAAGAGVVQAAVLDGASVLVNDTQLTLDVFTANPVGGLPRNDMVVFDAATVSIRLIAGVANATPTDPTVPTSAIPLARLRHAASATTIPTSKIDDLRTFTSLFGARAANKRVANGTVTVTPGGTGYATITHGAGFTPSTVTVSCQQAFFIGCDPDQYTATTFQVRLLNTAGLAVTTPTKVAFACFE